MCYFLSNIAILLSLVLILFKLNVCPLQPHTTIRKHEEEIKTWHFSIDLFLKNLRQNKESFFFFPQGKLLLDYPWHFFSKNKLSFECNRVFRFDSFVQSMHVQHFMPISKATLISLQYFGARATTGLVILRVLLLQVYQNQKVLYNYCFCLQLGFGEVL